MNIDVRARQAGKTRDMIIMAAEQGLYIVCMNLNEVDRISRAALDMGLDINQPITFKDFIE